MECVHNVVNYSLSVLNFCCLYLYDVHIKECTFDIFDKPITQVYKKEELTSVEIQEQTASLEKMSWKILKFGGHRPEIILAWLLFTTAVCCILV